MEDDDLLMRWARGDVDAGNVLITRHFTAIHRFVRGLCPHDADELTQRTFLGLLEGAERRERPRRFRAYLFGIARKQVLRLLHERRPDASLDDLSRSPVARLFDSPTSVIRKHERRDALLDALRELPSEVQATLQLHYWADLPVADIAEITDVNVSTVRSRLTRGRQSLGRLLDPLE